MTDEEILDIQTLYKMFSNKKYNYEAILKQELYLTTPDNYNDIFDGGFNFDYMEFERIYLLKKYSDCPDYVELLNKPESKKCALSALDRFINLDPENMRKNLKAFSSSSGDFIPIFDKEKIDKEIQEKYNQYLEQLNLIRNSYYITCFSKVEPALNIPMWYFYANDYRGFCCGFSLEKVKHDLYSTRLKEDDYNICKRLYRVEYVKQYIKIDIEHLLSLDIQSIYEDEQTNETIKKALCQKNEKWSNEEEIRLIIKKEDCFFDKYGFREETAGRLIKFPFLKEIVYCKVKIGKHRANKLLKIAKVRNVKMYELEINSGHSQLLYGKNNIKNEMHNHVLMYGNPRENEYSLTKTTILPF